MRNLQEQILLQVATAQQLSTLGYKEVVSLADTNIDYIKDCRVEEFCGITKFDKAENAIRKFGDLVSELRNLKYCLGKVQYWALDSDNLNYILMNKQISGHAINTSERDLLFAKRNTVNIQTAKVHEYEASLLIKLDDVAKEFYKKKPTWAECKIEMQKSVERIIEEVKSYG